MAKEKVYMCIDLKSFYASVECVERKLDPLKTRLVVADPTRTERTICLAVTPAMKALGVKNRCRVYEIPKSIDYITAPPQMALYIEYSARIYSIYLKYAAKEDIHVYSIDEVFIDATEYLSYRGQTPKQFAQMIMRDVLETVGITATCGIGSNLYLAKIALDIISKKSPDNIGILTEESYRKTLWRHRPLTDFWRIGRGTERRLERLGIQTMEEVAHASEQVLYKTFGIDAELLIDHAWGRESTTMADIKSYVPRTNSLTVSQVLHHGYDLDSGRIIVREMAESLTMELFQKGLCTRSATLGLGYSYAADKPPDYATVSLDAPTSSLKKITTALVELYDRIRDAGVPVHRVNITFNFVSPETCTQYDMFTSAQEQEREAKLQTAMLKIRGKYGKNSLIKCTSLQEGATMMERNRQIGGHRA